MSKEQLIKWRKRSFIGLVTLFLVMAVHMTIASISLHNNVSTSFPWQSAIFFLGIVYFLPMLIMLSIYLYFLIQSRRK